MIQNGVRVICFWSLFCSWSPWGWSQPQFKRSPPTDIVPITEFNVAKTTVYPGEEIWYSIELVQGQGYAFTMSPRLNTGWLRLRLYNTDAVLMYESGNIYNGNYGHLKVISKQNGVYFLRVTGSNDASGSLDLFAHQAWFNPDITDQSRQEHIFFYQARYLRSGNYFLSKFKFNTYRFVARKGDEITIQVSPRLNAGYVILRIYDQNEKLVMETGRVTDGKTGGLTFKPGIDSVYYARVSGSNTTNGHYDLTVENIQPDRDSDGDGLTDAAEYYLKTAVDRSDTDDDSLSDGDELRAGTNPLIDVAIDLADVVRAGSAAKAISVPAINRAFQAEVAPDSVWFRLDLKEGEGVHLVLSAALDRGYLKMRTYTPGQVLINETNTVYNGQTGRLNLFPARSGVYFIRVSGGSDESGTFALGVYHGWFGETLDNERDDFSNFYTARYLRSGNYELSPHGATYFRFTAGQSEQIQVNLTASLNRGYFLMRLYDRNGKQILESNRIYSDGFDSITHIAAVSDLYYLRVSGDDSASGSYNLAISGVRPDADADSDGLSNAADYFFGLSPELSDTDGDGASDGAEISQGLSPNHAIEIGEDVADRADSEDNAMSIPVSNDFVKIEFPGNSVWLKFFAQAGEGYSLALLPRLNSGWLSLRLYDENINFIKDLNNIYHGQTGALNHIAATTGTYYVRLSGGGDPHGYARLGLFPAWFNDGVQDRDRPISNTFFTAKSLREGTFFLDAFSSRVFRFQAALNEEFEITLAAQLNTGYVYMRLYDEVGNNLRESNRVYTGQSGVVTFNPAVSGVYYVSVRQSGADAGNFDLAIRGIDLDTSDDPIDIPDANLKAFLLERFDRDADGQITGGEAASVIQIDCSAKGIADLTGIEHFVGLRELNCQTNLLTTLPDLSDLSQLSTLICTQNQLTSLPNLPFSLVRLICDYNQIVTVPDLSYIPGLKVFGGAHNDIRQILNLPDWSALQSLNLSHNMLTDLAEAPLGLVLLNCSFNLLSSPPKVTGAANLRELRMEGNQFLPESCERIGEIERRKLESFSFNPQKDGSFLACNNDIQPPTVFIHTPTDTPQLQYGRRHAHVGWNGDRRERYSKHGLEQ